ncbi:MAG: Gldg family protein [Thermodesulfobacteriota bacterium]
MSEKKRFLEKSFFSVLGLALVLVILVMVNILFARVNLRWDATGENLYSLSDSTEKILQNLKNDVTIKVFYSKSVVNTPSYIKNYANRMLDFLSEYENYSNGKVKIEVYDPKADSEEEEWAQKYGIDGVDLATGEKIYLGLVAVAADQEEIIKALDSTNEERLEYDITRIILRVQAPQKPAIGLITGLPVMGQPPNPYTGQTPQPPWYFVTELQKTYTLKEIGPDASRIDPDINLLLIIHPAGVSEGLQYAVDQFILAGGNAVVFIDPFSTAGRGPAAAGVQPLKKLFDAWGISFDNSKTLADFSYATRVRAQNNQIEDNPFWISLPPETFNAGSLITSKLESMLLPATGVIQKTGAAGLTYEPLLQSSANSALIDSSGVQKGVEEIRRDFKPQNQKFDLAVKITGTFKTAFKEGRPKVQEKAEAGAAKTAPPKSEGAAAPLTTGLKPATVIVVADADLLFDGYYLHKQNFLGFNIARIFNDNLNFVLNSSEMLAGGPDLINIRSRGKFEKPFTRVKALEEKAQMKWLVREQELIKKVEETNRKLEQLERQKDASQRLIVSSEQEVEIKKFQEEKRRINKELKIVRRNLRAEIESLGRTVKLINIFLMPLLIAICGIVFAILRRRKSAGV